MKVSRLDRLTPKLRIQLWAMAIAVVGLAVWGVVGAVMQVIR